MVVMKAKLAREQTPVYFCGEAIECLVEFENPEQPQHKQYQNNRDSFQNLAWASVQVHCYRKTNISGEKFESANQEFIECSGTALGTVVKGGAEILISTNPKILFCDLKLYAGETKTFYYREILPSDGPPTYRGHDIKYFYRVTVATQRVKSRVQTLSIPVRVLPLPRLIGFEDLRNETTEELTPSNPFLEPKKMSDVEIAWQHLLNVTARRSPKFFRISNKRGLVGRFCIFKSAYKLGEDIVGTLDFSNREVRCVQFSVTLQCEEIFKKPIKSTLSKGLTDTNNQDDNSTLEQTGRITDHSKCHEFCLSMLQTQVIIPVSLYVTPTFSTDRVDVRWRLHFEFVTSTMVDYGNPDENTGEWKAPLDISIETMIWNLPVTLYPTSPLQIYTPSLDYSIKI